MKRLSKIQKIALLVSLVFFAATACVQHVIPMKDVDRILYSYFTLSFAFFSLAASVYFSASTQKNNPSK